MVSEQFHFNGFSPNMLYFFSFFLSFFRRLYLATPTFIIEPKSFAGQRRIIEKAVPFTVWIRSPAFLRFGGAKRNEPFEAAAFDASSVGFPFG